MENNRQENDAVEFLVAHACRWMGNILAEMASNYGCRLRIDTLTHLRKAVYHLNCIWMPPSQEEDHYE